MAKEIDSDASIEENDLDGRHRRPVGINGQEREGIEIEAIQRKTGKQTESVWAKSVASQTAPTPTGPEDDLSTPDRPPAVSEVDTETISVDVAGGVVGASEAIFVNGTEDEGLGGASADSNKATRSLAARFFRV
ncbi:UNVERIFIED_CONTAM: hypothetical protein K2H54_074441 [Gekko kuhli]